MHLKIDEDRYAETDQPETGIYVRAESELNGKWDSVCISKLRKESLLEWLKSRGGDNPLAENVVGCLLGWGHLHS